MFEVERLHVFLSPEVQQVLLDHETDVEELLRKAAFPVKVESGADPALNAMGKKEPATILLASAAVIAAATPLLRDLIRALSGRDTVIIERRLVPVQDDTGKLVRGTDGEPVLHWAEVGRERKEPEAQVTKIKGLGVEISFGAK